MSRMNLAEALEQSDIASGELRCRIQDGLIASLGDTYDCTRVWSAWDVGTMDQDDFEPVLDRLDDLVDTLFAHISREAAAKAREDAK